MRMTFLKPILVVVVVVITALRASKPAKYTLAVPKVAQAGRTLDFLLTVHYSDPSNAMITLTSTASSIDILASMTVSLTEGINSLSLPLPDNLDTTKHHLKISNDEIDARATLNIRVNPYAIVIQTDKPVYKPSQTVRVRVAIFDDYLRPVNETITAIVQDAESNTIAQWRDIPTEMGLTQLELPLSEQPPLGDWQIMVVTKYHTASKTIKIDKYVLPKFEVNIELPSYILTSTDSLSVNVSAVYTFGESVVGVLTRIKLSSSTTRNTVEKKGIDMLRSSTTPVIDTVINGKAEVEFFFSDLQILKLSDSSMINVYVEVLETLSGKTMNVTSSIDVYALDYLVTFMDINTRSFVPGKPYTAYFDVGRPDGSRIKSEEITLEVTASYYTNSRITISKRALVPSSGITTVTISMPQSGSLYSVDLYTKLYVNGEVIEGASSYAYLDRFRTVNNNVTFSIVSDIMGVLKVGDAVSVDVSCSSNSGRYFYAAVARGKPVISGTGQLSSPSFTLKVTQDFTPQVTIIAYAVVNNELVGDSVSTNVDGVFENQVSLEIQDSDGNEISVAEPGDNVNVKIDTEAGSMIGLLSVDKSILLLGGSGHDVTQSQILSSMMSLIKSSTTCSGSDDEGPVFNFFSFPRFGSASTEDVFSSAGLQVVTDADMSECYESSLSSIMNILLRLIEFHRELSAHDIDIVDYVILMNMDVMAGQASSVAETKASKTNQETNSDIKRSKPRQNFPETWLWSLQYSDKSSTVRNEVVPDTITSWITTAISMHPSKGIAVSSEPAKLTVKMPFFITPVLPYDAVKGEELSLKILVYNYGDKDDVCTVSVSRSDEYEVKLGENDLYLPDGALESEVHVKKGSGGVVTFWIRPLVMETISIAATASCTSRVRDSFIRKLLVKPPGYPVEECESEFVELEKSAESWSHVFRASVPNNAVNGSKRVTVSVTGDVMGPSIDGLENLIQMPYGCGEQNMITFTPNIFVRRYLESVNKLTAEIIDNTNKYMQKGYQRELTYRHSDGSFSAFGESDPSGSTWLTAFVMKCFRQASDYITIDTSVMRKAKDWLLAKIDGSGEFSEPGKVCHQDMQGGSSKGLTLTAYVIIAMLEDVSGDDLTNRRETLEKSKTYLEGEFETIRNDPYKLAIVTYALRLIGSRDTGKFLRQLESLQTTTDGMVWWEMEDSSSKASRRPYYHTSVGPSSVEMTSYALLTYLDLDDKLKAKLIVKWLTKNRGSRGGFTSTQDTVLALQALAVYSKLLISDSTNLDVMFEAGSLSYGHVITNDNAILMKRHSFKPADGIESVSVAVSGQGSAIVSSCTSYNVLTLPIEPTVEVTSEVLVYPDSTNVLKACLKYTADGESGMGLTEARAATGYSFDLDDSIVVSGDFARMEPSSGGVAVYWNELNRSPSCVEIRLVEDFKVINVKDSYVVGTQYYKPEYASRSFYNPTNSKSAPAKPNPSSGTVQTSDKCYFVTLCVLSIYRLLVMMITT